MTDATTFAPVGTFTHDVPAGTKGDWATFDREGHAFGRQALAPELVRALRTPLVDALVADGDVERVEGDEDRLRWIGDREHFNRWAHVQLLRKEVEERLVRSGILAAAVESVWGRRPVLWVGAFLFLMIPGDPIRIHRDGWYMQGVGAPGEHFNFWCPLTAIAEDEGPLAIAAGSHRIADQPARLPVIHPMHQEVLANTGVLPAEETLAPHWRASSFEPGDVLVFRPDIIHSTAPNDGPYLRIAFNVGGQAADVPLAKRAGLTHDPTRRLDDVEWLTLAILAVQPSTPWMARQAFCPRGIIGRLGREEHDGYIDRSFATLRTRGLIEPREADDEDVTEFHEYFQATPAGRHEVTAWLTTPGPSNADLLALKLLFCDWLDLDTTALLAG